MPSKGIIDAIYFRLHTSFLKNERDEAVQERLRSAQAAAMVSAAIRARVETLEALMRDIDEIATGPGHRYFDEAARMAAIHTCAAIAAKE